MGVVTCDLRDVPCCVGDTRNLAAATDGADSRTGRIIGVISVGGSVQYIGTRAIHRQHRTVGVIGIGPSTRSSGWSGGETLLPPTVGGRLQRLAQQVATTTLVVIVRGSIHHPRHSESVPEPRCQP